MKAHCPLVAFALVSTWMVACGSSGGGSTGGPVAPSVPTGSRTTGIALPREVSAISAKGAPAGARTAVLRSPVHASAKLGADTDYAKTTAVKFVNERSLAQFETLNAIFHALAQTHYEDAAVLGKGPYAAMVSWTEERAGQQVKEVVKWQVESTLIQEGGVDVNRVQVYFPRTNADGSVQTIRVQVKILEPPRMNPDGASYADYGKWRLSAAFDPGAGSFLAASAERDAAGSSIVRIHEFHPSPGAGSPPWETKGVLHRSGDTGVGRVRYMDTRCRNQAPGEPCPATPFEVAYVFDGSTVTLKDGDDAVVSRDRRRVVDVVGRYGLFDAGNGAKVVGNFGFPFRYPDRGGNPAIGYYGAWQGRHQFWTGEPSGVAVPRGTVVTRLDVAPGQVAPSYTASGAFDGTLIRRDLVPASVAELTGIFLEIGEVAGFRLYPDGNGGWCRKDGSGDHLPLDDARFSCATADARPWTDADFAAWLEPYPNGQARGVAPVYFDEQAREARVLVYAAAGEWGPAGLYEAEFSGGDSGPWTMKVPYAPFVQPPQHLELCVQTFETIYVSWNGSGWVRKEVLSFDREAWLPIVGTNDTPYTLELGREYDVRSTGGNYVVKRTESGLEVRAEMQRVANPGNVAAIVASGTTFVDQYVPLDVVPSEFQFDADPASPTFLKLLYASPGDYEPAGAAAGGVATGRKISLLARVEGQLTGVQFSWDYPTPSSPGGSQEYLTDGSAFVLLDPPIRLAPVSLTSGAGDTRIFQVQFDGNWIQGLPELRGEIQKANGAVTLDIAGRVVVIPDGTELAGQGDGRTYVFKQLVVEEYLYPTDAAALDLGPAFALDLGTVPGYVAPDPPMPGPSATAPLLYSEGTPVGAR